MEATMLSSSLNGTPSGSGAQQWLAPKQHAFASQAGPNAQFPNGMPGGNNMMMPPINMFPGFLQQMATQTARPIGSIDDDQVLVRAFRERNGRNYRQVLESLDMKNGYSAQQWKDYYLDHTPRLRRLITPPPPRPVTTSAMVPKVEESISQAPAKSAGPSKSKQVTSSKAPLPKGYAYGRTKTDGLPAPPSRSPSPPTLVIAGPRGNKFTDQDKDYFLRYILWALQCDPSLTRQELCNNLEDKAPHHTAQSWGSYWRHHGELADKALERTRGEVSADTISSSSSDEEDYRNSNPKKASASARVRMTSNSMRTSAANAPYSAPPRARGNRADAKVDQEKMGPGGGSITTEDKRELARYVASHTAQDWQNKRQRFVAFHDKWPQRSAAAWAETYRRFPEEIDTFVAIFRSQAGDDWSTIWSAEREGELPPMHRVKIEDA